MLERTPRILLFLTGSLEWFLADSCFQVQYAKDHFHQSDSLYHYVMLFGICIAPATFEHMVDSLLRGLKWKGCHRYLDGIVGPSATFPERICRLREVLYGFHIVGLQLNSAKCIFGNRSVKAKSYGSWHMARPIQTLWCFSPVLGRFVAGVPTELWTDALCYGLGAILAQTIDDTTLVIVHATHMLSKCERNCSSSRKMCLALVWAISEFRPCHYGFYFRVVPDHYAFCWLSLASRTHLGSLVVGFSSCKASISLFSANLETSD